MSPVVVGLDLSLTGTGVARIESGGPCSCDADLVPPHRRAESGCPGAPAIRHARMETPTAGKALDARSRRLRGLAAQVCLMCEGADLVIVEEPAYGASGGSAHDRSGLWWLIIARLTMNRTPCVEVVTQHLKMYVTGRGTKVGKDLMLAEVIRRYGALIPELSSNDEADAFAAAALGWHHYTGTPLIPLPLTHTRTLDRIRWPSTTERGHRA